MTFGLTAVLASALVTVGVLIGWQLRAWRLDARTRRQAAAQLSLFRQLHELRTARQNGHPVSSEATDQANRSHRRVA